MLDGFTIGFSDDGTALGIDADRFENEDKLGRHIKFKENDIKAFLEENVREGEVMHLHHK